MAVFYVDGRNVDPVRGCEAIKDSKRTSDQVARPETRHTSVFARVRTRICLPWAPVSHRAEQRVTADCHCLSGGLPACQEVRAHSGCGGLADHDWLRPPVGICTCSRDSCGDLRTKPQFGE